MATVKDIQAHESTAVVGVRANVRGRRSGNCETFTELIPPGACRNSIGGEGPHQTRQELNLDSCWAACAAQFDCMAFEYNRDLTLCELHMDPIAQTELTNFARCFVHFVSPR